MPKTGLYMNWSGVSVTPNGGTLIPVTDVTDCSFPRSGTNKTFWGDNRLYARDIRTTNQVRQVMITTGNLAALDAVPIGTVCTVVATLNDAHNGVGSGARTYTAINAVLASKPDGSTNNEYANTTYSFDCFGSALDADPISVVNAS